MKTNLQKGNFFQKIRYDSSLFIVLIAAMWLLLFFIVGMSSSIAVTTYSSVSNGEWETNVWSSTGIGGPSCGCHPGGNFNKLAEITTSVSFSTRAKLKLSGGGTVNIMNANSKFVVNADLEMSGNSLININGGDTLIVNGKLKVDNSIINIDGYLEVNGDVDIKNGTINISLPFGGKFNINGNLDMTSNSQLNISGGDTLTLNGNLTMDNSDIDVSGYFAANGNADLNNSTVCGIGSGMLSGTLTGSTWCFTVLPIKLISFEALEENSHVVLNWTTASEINNDYFTIESSTDAENYKELLKIAGTGNSTSRVNYIAYDNNPKSGMNYYRLRQTDFDGHTEYFQPFAININADAKTNSLTLKSSGPNPFTSQFTVNFYLPNTSDVVVQMTNSTGVVIFNDVVKADEGTNVFTYNDTQNLYPGIYNLRVVKGKDIISKTIIKN